MPAGEILPFVKPGWQILQESSREEEMLPFSTKTRVQAPVSWVGTASNSNTAVQTSRCRSSRKSQVSASELIHSATSAGLRDTGIRRDTKLPFAFTLAASRMGGGAGDDEDQSRLARGGIAICAFQLRGISPPRNPISSIPNYVTAVFVAIIPIRIATPCCPDRASRARRRRHSMKASSRPWQSKWLSIELRASDNLRRLWLL